MQFILKKILSTLVLMLFGGVTLAISQSPLSDGGLAGAPFRLGFGARGIGMGNALTSVPYGDISSYYNPALLPFEVNPTVLLSYGSLSLDRRLNFVSYAQSLKPDAGLSLGLINAGVGNIDGRDRDGQPTETYSTSENEFFLSFGLRPERDLAFGVTAKILYYHLFTDIKSTTAGIDIGGLYFISDQLCLAFTLQDLLSKYKWDTSKLYGENGSSTEDKFPLRKRIGLSYSSVDMGLIVSAEAERIGSAGYCRFGAELDLFSGFQIRAGIDQVAFARNVDSKPSIGFSAQTQISALNPRIDYAFVVEPYVQSGMHFLTLSLSFQ